MDMDTNSNAVNEKTLKVEATDDSCRDDFVEVVPITRDTDGSAATECVSGDWFSEVREVDLADLKQEPNDVCCVLYPVFSLSLHRICYQTLLLLCRNRLGFLVIF